MLGKLRNVAQKKKVYQGCDTDFSFVQQEGKEQQNQIDDHIKGPKADGYDAGQTAHERLKRITPREACLNIPTLIPHMSTPIALIHTLLCFMRASQLLFLPFPSVEYHKSPHNSTVGDDHFLNCADLGFRFSGREQLT